MSNNYNQTLQSNNIDLQAILDTVNELPNAGGGGIDTSDATATSNDILSGKTAYADGEKITGNIPSKSSSDLTSSGATVTVPAGHYASQVTKTIASGSAKTPATTITKNPTISVNSSGLITASVSGTQSVTPTVTSGYVSSGTAGTITVSGSATKQLTVQAAQTITPGTSDKTIASGRYLTGTQTIKGDANLVAGNIKSGVSIFGITGTHSGGEDLEAIISEQEALIEELSTTLDSKASGGSGGGGSVETCTVIVSVDSDASFHEYCYLSVSDDGNVNVSFQLYSPPLTNTTLRFENVICGSTIHLDIQGIALGWYTDNVGTVVGSMSNHTPPIFIAPSVKNSTGTIIFVGDD